MLNVAALETEMDKEVKNGWLLPLTIDSVRHVKYASVVPLGVANKWSINEKGVGTQIDTSPTTDTYQAHQTCL